MRTLILTLICIFTFMGLNANAATWYDDKDNPYYSFYQKIIPHVIEYEEPDWFNIFHTNLEEMEYNHLCDCLR